MTRAAPQEDASVARAEQPTDKPRSVAASVPAGGAKGSPTISREERMAQLEQELNAGRSTSGGGGPTPRTQDE